MLLYHYSNIDIKGYIKPDYFGLNSFSNNSKRLSAIKRSYFYIEPDKKEYYFNGVKYLYIIEVNKKKLYNLNEDKLNIVKNSKNSQDIHREVKRKGFFGLIGSNGLPCAVLFKVIKIKDRKTLTK